jgi:hypothetical protein
LNVMDMLKSLINHQKNRLAVFDGDQKMVNCDDEEYIDEYINNLSIN